MIKFLILPTKTHVGFAALNSSRSHWGYSKDSLGGTIESLREDYPQSSFLIPYSKAELKKEKEILIYEKLERELKKLEASNAIQLELPFDYSGR